MLGKGEMMVKNQYGLSRIQRDRLVRMAQSGFYYERYLSEKFRITDEAVRDLCARNGYVCKRLDVDLKHYNGYEMAME